MLNGIRLLSAIVAMGFSRVAVCADPAALAGVVVGPDDAPVANARVLYRSVPTVTRQPNGHTAVSGPLLGSGVRTEGDGSFAVTGLPAATYEVCAYGTADHHLGSCEWVQGTKRVVLAPGQTAHVKLQLGEGTLLTFQVEDSKRQIRDLEDMQTTAGRISLSGWNFGIGVWAGSRYVRARLVSTSGVTRRYQVAIPKPRRAAFTWTRASTSWMPAVWLFRFGRAAPQWRQKGGRRS